MLRIGRFVTECQVPKGRPEVYGLVDSIAREQFAHELSARIGPSLSRQPGVVRIERLRIRIELRGRTLDRGRLIDAWTRAVCRQLFTALAYPHGGGQFEIHRADSAPHFRAEFIRDLLSGAAQSRWYYRSRAAALKLPCADGVLAALREDPGEIAETLEALAALGELEPAIAILDDVACEEIFRAIAASDGAPLEERWQEALASIARVFRRHPPSRGLRLDSRAQALRMFALARGMDVRLGPRVWFTALTALALLAGNGELWTASGRPPEQICGCRLAPDVAALLRFVRDGAAGTVGAAASAHSQLLMAALDAAGLRVPDPVVSQSEPEPWRELEGASLLLLTGPLVGLGWAADWPGVARQATLYALGCAIRGGFDPAMPAIDRDAAVFAGIFGEASLPGLRGFFAASAPPLEGAADWPSAIDSLAARLITWWTARLPGFRKATRAAIVRQFLTAPGRVRVEEKRVLVSLVHQPAFVALRIASLDEAVESVPWFDGRRLEFRIEGL
jgi:hypothetical protein